MKIINIVGARPNFMKIAPLMESYRDYPHIRPLLVHTGQHYDEKMSDLFFRQLGIPEPDLNLDAGSGSHAAQTASIMTAIEPVLLDERPDALLVVGDVNSTIACGLVAVKLGIPLIHVEAGLRSFDRSMPEEVNRVLTDSISELFFCTEQSGVDNLLAEGIAPGRIHLVGNVMIDTLLRNREKAEASNILAEHGLEAENYAVMTLHRPSNVDDPAAMGRILDAVQTIQQDMPLVFPVHPRTEGRLRHFGLSGQLDSMKNVLRIPPSGYLDFLKLTANAAVVLTDSGGIQEESTILGVPCITLRENTERPVTVEVGANRLAGNDTGRILEAYRRSRLAERGGWAPPPFWDGKAAERTVAVIDQWWDEICGRQRESGELSATAGS